MTERFVKRVAIISFSPEKSFDREATRWNREERSISAARLSELAIVEREYRTKSSRVVSTTYFPMAGQDLPSLNDFDAAIIPGSPLAPTKAVVSHNFLAKQLLKFILDACLNSKPLLGICFGHEAIGAAMGVYPVHFGPDIGAEIGFHDVRLTKEGVQDPLFKGVSPSFKGAFFHMYYLPSVPEDATPLAFSPDGRVQAFQAGSLYGVQFHPDFDSFNLLQLIGKRRAMLSNIPGFDLPKIVESAVQVDCTHNMRILQNFLDIVADS